jgi:hypothetical protein
VREKRINQKDKRDTQRCKIKRTPLAYDIPDPLLTSDPDFRPGKGVRSRLIVLSNYRELVRQDDWRVPVRPDPDTLEYAFVYFNFPQQSTASERGIAHSERIRIRWVDERTYAPRLITVVSAKELPGIVHRG